MRVLIILALTVLMTGCNGDRIKDSMNSREEQHDLGEADLKLKPPSVQPGRPSA
jgi:hypothetical protein